MDIQDIIQLGILLVLAVTLFFIVKQLHSANKVLRVAANAGRLDAYVSLATFIVCPRGMGEKPSPLGEDFQYACGSVGV